MQEWSWAFVAQSASQAERGLAASLPREETDVLRFRDRRLACCLSQDVPCDSLVDAATASDVRSVNPDGPTV